VLRRSKRLSDCREQIMGFEVEQFLERPQIPFPNFMHLRVERSSSILSFLTADGAGNRQ